MKNRITVSIAALILITSTPLHPWKSSNLAVGMCSRNPLISALGFAGYFYDTAQTWYIHRQAAHFPQPLPLAQPQKIVFAFDLHHVLFMPDTSLLFHRLMAMPHKRAFLKRLFKPLTIYTAAKLFFKGQVVEKSVLDLVTEFTELDEFVEKSRHLANSLKPIDKTFQLIKQLKKQGFSIYLFSNIGKNTFEALRKQAPYYFEDFDGFYTTSPEHTYLSKPDYRIYLLFLDNFNLKKENVVFIDDRPKNINAARAIGMRAILFTSADHLECVLNAMGAFSKKLPVVIKDCPR